jgi:hypothetical protein
LHSHQQPLAHQLPLQRFWLQQILLPGLHSAHCSMLQGRDSAAAQQQQQLELHAWLVVLPRQCYSR